jgi:hypothetical protein
MLSPTLENKITPEIVEPYITIIKYLNHQKFKVQNDWLSDIKNISDGTPLNLETLNISSEQLSQIKRLEPLLKKSFSPQKQNNLHLYYVFIILNLPNYMVKNITRSYLAKLYLNTQKKSCFHYLDIIKRNNYLNDLISILEDTHEEIDIFIDTINHFFT